jgi:16S rRNA (uracil1498-N3)-methyltransferase
VTPPVFVVSSADLVAAAPGSVLRLDGAEGRHAASVRRLAFGEPVRLVDGDGRRAEGVVADVIGKQALDITVSEVTLEPPPAPWVVVVQALPKGDRGELAVELMTEVGIDEIVPWAADNCVTRWQGERVDRGLRRWTGAALAAGKQARRARFPVIAPLASTGQVIDRLERCALGVVLNEEAADPIGGVQVPTGGEIVIVIGPEGGITLDELAAFTAVKALTVRLGPSVLRTSSAGLAAASVLLAHTSRWHGGLVEG